jgi:hypothetical protein
VMNFPRRDICRMISVRNVLLCDLRGQFSANSAVKSFEPKARRSLGGRRSRKRTATFARLIYS